MKNIFLILFALNTLSCFAQSNNNNPRVFNVKMFGAKGDGVTDATTYIQAAINACNAAGGGTVYFPNGIYIIAGAINASYNAQLYIPSVTLSNASRNHITILGEGKPNFVPVGTGLSGSATIPIAASPVILKSTLTTFTTAGQAVIGSSALNETFLSVENIAIQVKNNPSGTGPVVGGISFKQGPSLQTKNVAVYVDTSGYRSTLPQNDVTGIETTDNNLETFNSLENTLVIGMKSGYKIGEHVILNQAQAFCCYYGFNIKQGHHASGSLRAGTYWCAYDIYISGFCTLQNFQLDTEWQQIGNWYDDIATIKDSGNVATGKLFYTIIEASFGKNNTRFLKSGGANLNTYADDVAYLTSIGIGTPLTSATAGSIPYVGPTSLLTQDNANLFWDATNKRLGIGTASPQSNLDISGTSPLLFLNATTANGQIGFHFRKNGVTKWQLLTDFFANGTPDFSLYDQVHAKAVIYADAAGTLNLGGTASVASTSGISIDNSKNVSFDNGKFNWDATNHWLVANSHYGGTTGGGTLTLSSTTNATKGFIKMGASVYDESNNRLGINNLTPTYAVDIAGTDLTTTTSRISNSTTSSYSTFGAYTGTAGGFFRTYGTTFPVASLANKTSFGPDGSSGLVVFTNASSTSGGSGSLSIRGGGYDLAAEKLFADKGGVSIGNGTLSSATALLYLAAGTATAGTAPLKFTSGVKLTTPEAGVFEFDGTNFWMTISTIRYLITPSTQGTAAPTTTPAAVGIHFIDTTNKKDYVATGTSSSADWTILN